MRFDRALDGVLGQSVDGNGGGLAWPQPRELRFLEVGVDVDRVERHQARQPLAGLHVVAGLHRAVADHAVERRADDALGPPSISAAANVDVLKGQEQEAISTLDELKTALAKAERDLSFTAYLQDLSRLPGSRSSLSLRQSD